MEILLPFGKETWALLASRTNAQFPLYSSWRADPIALAVNAFMDGTLPLYIPQISSNFALKSLVDSPILLSPITQIVTNPAGQNHPLAIKSHLPLVTWPPLGKPARQEDFRLSYQYH